MIQVLVVTDTDRAFSWVTEAVEGEEDIVVTGRANNPAETEQALKDSCPDAIVVDAAIGEIDMVSLTQDLMFKGVRAPIVALTIEGDIERARQLILAGARSFVPIPLRDGELARTLRQVVEMENIRRVQVPVNGSAAGVRRRNATCLAVYSPKGGVGCTTLSANLAVALQIVGKQKVILLDAARQLGHVGLVMNLRAPHTLPDLLPHISELDPELMRRIVVNHISGIDVLLSSPQVKKDKEISPKAIQRIIEVLTEMYDFIVVDVPKTLDEYSFSILKSAGHILTVVVPEVPAIRDTKLFLEACGQTDHLDEKIELVLNRASGDHGVKVSEIESALKHKIIAQIPEDPSLVSYALNRGVPFVQSHQRSPVGKSVLLLAQRLAGGEEKVAPVAVPNPVQVDRRDALPPLRGLRRIK